MRIRRLPLNTVHLHLIPIRGANTMQRIGILRCVDLETGAVVADMHDACEVFVRG